jgi:hypothetical protein
VAARNLSTGIQLRVLGFGAGAESRRPLGLTVVRGLVFSLSEQGQLSKGLPPPCHCRPKTLRVYPLYIHCWKLVHEHCAGFSFRKQSGPSGCRSNFDWRARK